jgi:hypothetical protein
LVHGGGENELDGMTSSVLYGVLEDIQATIQGAGLSGLPSSNVVIDKAPADRNRTLPAVVIAPLEERIDRNAGPTQRDDVGYQVGVYIVAADNQDQSANYQQYLNWRQNIRRLFHNKRIGSNSTASLISFVKPLAVAHPAAWFANLFLSIVIVQCLVREQRT